MHAPGPRACCQCWRECSGRRSLGPSPFLLAAAGDTAGLAHSFWGEETSAPKQKSRPRVSGPGVVPLFSCLVPCPGGGAVGQASRGCGCGSARVAPGASWSREEEGGEHVTRPSLSPPSTSALKVLSASDEGRRRSAQPQGLHPGLGSGDSPEARAPEGRFRGGRPPQFLCLPGGGAIFARWASKNRKVESRGRAKHA